MQTPEVIVVLGRGISHDGTLPPDPKARIQTAVNLLTDYPQAFLIMSGKWSFHLETPPVKPEAEAMAEFAQQLGVSKEKIILEQTSSDTISNAYYVKTQVLIPHNWKNLIVVSSADHMERVKFIFEHVLGSDYSIKFVTSPLVIPSEEVETMAKKEKRSLWGAEKLFKDIRPGDHEKVMTDVLIPYIPGIGPDREQTLKNIEKLATEYREYLTQTN